MNVDWKVVASSLWQALASLEVTLEERIGVVRVSKGENSTDVFPLRIYFSLCGRVAGVEEELVVVSFDCWLDGSKLHLSSDIARGNGHILSDGPAESLDLQLAGNTSGEAVLAWAERASRFVVASSADVCGWLQESLEDPAPGSLLPSTRPPSPGS